jgi:hypothetical protein
MPAAASRGARFFFENQGKWREPGTERTSAIMLTSAPCSRARKRSAGMLEWPMLNRLNDGMSADLSKLSINSQFGDRFTRGATLNRVPSARE